MADATNIYLPKELTPFIDKVYDSGCFKDRITICKFGFSYAVKYHFSDFNPADVDLESNANGINYNVGSIDVDKFLYNFVISAYPDCDTPYKYIRGIMIFGLKKLSDKLKDVNNISIFDLM